MLVDKVCGEAGAAASAGVAASSAACAKGTLNTDVNKLASKIGLIEVLMKSP
jgi:hypothetical protein